MQPSSHTYINMEYTHTPGYPVGRRLSAKYDGTFGATTLKERLPKIVTQIIDRLHRYNSTLSGIHGEEGTTAIKSVLAKLSEFRYRMQTNKEMLPIGTGPDVTEWTSVFEAYRKKLGHEPRWFEVSWLFFECYMYRKVIEIIRTESLLQDYDPFQNQKEESLVQSMDQIETVSTQLMKQESSVNKDMFKKYLMLSLWGNKADLSMAATIESYEMTHQEESLDAFILADDSDHIWDLLTKKEREKTREIAIVLDNSGFELFSDLVFAEWLLKSGLADHVSLYCKTFPWFISDATRKDIEWTLEQFVASSVKAIAHLGQELSKLISEGTLSIKEHHYWTTSFEYSAMNKVCPDLYASLSSAKLVIFKGDLNYRKLIGDRNWVYTSSFSTSLQSFRPTNVVALRTLKADLVAGLTEGAAARAASLSSDWMIKGMFAIVQLAPAL